MRSATSCIALAAATLLPLPSTAAQHDAAADYPNQPVRLVVTFVPGASNDILARLIGKLNPEVNKALQRADVKARLDQLGFETEGGAPQAFDTVVKAETARIEQLLRAGLLQKTD